MPRPPASRQDLGALRGRIVEYAQIPRELAFRREGPHVDPLEAVADANLPRVMHQPFDELTVNPFMDVEALGSCANLTAIEERSEGGAARRDIDGRRGHDDEGIIPGGFTQSPLVRAPESVRPLPSCCDESNYANKKGFERQNQRLLKGPTPRTRC